MRTHHFATIDITQLATISGGCHKAAPPPQPPPQPAAPVPPRPRGLDVTVATGAQGGAAIQQALQGGAV